MEVLRNKLSAFQFHLILNIVFGVFITLSSYIYTPISSFKDFILYVCHFLLQQFCCFGFLYILSLNRFVFKICFPILFIVLSIASFWAFTMDISFSDGIVQATIETKPDIVLDLISIPLILFVIISVVIVLFILKLYSNLETKKNNILLLIFAVIAIAMLFIVDKTRSRTLSSRLPFNVFFELVNYFNKSDYSYSKINTKINADNKNLNVYLILGESVRADHFSLNGYSRLTNPLLAQQQNLISFSNAYTSFTYTAGSIPQILSNKSVYDSIKNARNYNIINILNQSGIETFWIGNQTPEKSYNNFINDCKNRLLIDPLHSVFSYNKKSDLALLQYLPNVQNRKGNVFSIFHTIGSHWYYENRYTKEFRKFCPTITSKNIPSNTRQEMINSYDNTIVFLDYFLNKFIEKVKSKNENAIILYVSDHGELLGENGKWLHGLSGNEKGPRNPAVLFWYSDIFKEKYPNEIKFLESKQKKQFTLDAVYHTILDLYKIETSYYNKKESLLYNN
ncbi:phosphoethanolamine transferase [Flavobacterium sp.]|uniref:phosphoethanolamine transferase n=1 Tax=Flavobacterium sp. TaxID=239 RepID=UPI00352847BE